jgi:hypothetical protein
MWAMMEKLRINSMARGRPVGLGLAATHHAWRRVSTK